MHAVLQRCLVVIGCRQFRDTPFSCYSLRLTLDTGFARISAAECCMLRFNRKRAAITPVDACNQPTNIGLPSALSNESGRRACHSVHEALYDARCPIQTAFTHLNSAGRSTCRTSTALVSCVRHRLSSAFSWLSFPDDTKPDLPLQLPPLTPTQLWNDTTRTSRVDLRVCLASAKCEVR